MKKLIIILITLLVIILLILAVGGIYAYLVLKPFLSSSSTAIGQFTTTPAQTSTDKHPLLNASQEATLEKLGIDQTKLPTTITPAMEDCFTQKLGVERVNEIKAGASPNAVDLFKAKSCL